MVTAERRLEKREESMMVVNFSYDGRAYTEFTRNISQSGLCIESSIKIPVGQDLIMVVQAPSGDPIKLTGKVVWSDTGQTGVHLH